jgi:hypothetical protein
MKIDKSIKKDRNLSIMLIYFNSSVSMELYVKRKIISIEYFYTYIFIEKKNFLSLNKK